MSQAERDAELALTPRVGRERASLGLREHVARARAYYAATRAGRPSDARSTTTFFDPTRSLPG
jgi:hypothetical protein